MSSRSLVLPVDGRRMISTGVGITLVAAGAVLRFAVPATFTHGLNMHVVGVVVMLVGVFGLLLSLLVWGPLDRRRNHYGGFAAEAPCPPRQRSAYQDQPPAGGSSTCDQESALRESGYRAAHRVL